MTSTDSLFYLGSLGKQVADFILWVAGWLKSPAAPGWFSLAIFVVLLAAVGLYFRRSARTRKAIRQAQRILDAKRSSYDKDRFLEIQRAFRAWEEEPRRSPRHRLSEAWREFAETVNRQPGLFNTVRPNEFFGREPLRMEHRIFAQLPPLFVSVGLLLTFLGLVAALDQTREILDPSASGSVNQALQELLTVAGAKFIMSLTGLFSSIVFGFLFRTGEGKTDEALHALCAEIERGFEYRSADNYLLDRILEVLREQGAHLQTFSTELVAQVARPLREEIPQALRESIREAMAPSLEQFERGAGQGLESMVASVTQSMSGTVQDSAHALNETMEKVSDRLDDVATRLDHSAESMGGQVGQAVAALSGEITKLQAAMAESSREATDNLNQGARSLLTSMEEALQAIRDSSQAGADGVDRAATAMTGAVEALTTRAGEASEAAVQAGSRTIDEASRRAAQGLGESSRAVIEEMAQMSARITSQVEGVSSALQSGVEDHLRDLTESIGELNHQMVKSVDGVRRYSETVEGGSKAVAQASQGLETSSVALRQTAEPLRSAVERMETSNRGMERKVTATANALESGARDMTNHVVVILKAAEGAIRDGANAAAETRKAIEHTMKEFETLVARFIGLDQRLGDAWKQLDDDVSRSLGDFRRFERELNQEFGRSLSKLREVIDQMEPFKPVSEGAETSTPARSRPY